MKDHAILALFHERQEEAITQSRLKYGNYCYRIAHRILSSHEDAEECLNDTLLRAWNNIPPDQPASLGGYLGAITRRLSLDRYRRQHSQKRTNGEPDLALSEIETVFANDHDLDDAIAEAELVKAINAFLKSLPERERTIMVCRYFHLYSVTDIAKRYQMKEKAVYALLSRTLAKLKKYLEKENTV